MVTMNSPIPASDTPVLKLGTRASKLALTQSQMVADAIEEAGANAGAPVRVELVQITTHGDVDPTPLSKLGGTGVFVARLRESLLAGECDIAVHSCKDLPTGDIDGLTLVAMPPREDVRDALCSRGGVPLAELPEGAKVGTGSPRRSAQILATRPDIQIVDIRGNVPTRLARINEDLDAVILATAGLNRLGMSEAISQYLPINQILPAAAQGALAVEVRSDWDPALIALVASLDDPATHIGVTAERSLMNALGAGCAAPLGALGTIDDGVLTLHGRVIATDGSQVLERVASCPIPLVHDSTSAISTEMHEAAILLGRTLAQTLLRAGAEEVADIHATKNQAK